MKLVWLTDIHLNFLDIAARDAFYQKIIETQSDGIVISGDIAEAPSLCSLLIEMEKTLSRPIYFVLGNHDYYLGKISEVQQAITILTAQQVNLHWVSNAHIIQLTASTVLIGQDGWADGRMGDYHSSRINLNDSRLIMDLYQKKCLGREHLLSKMQSLADDNAKQLKYDLLCAIEQGYRYIIVVTHVPPFKENCLYAGKISGDEYLPYFGSQVMGDLLLEIADRFLKVEFTVLCGHTHSASSYQPKPNLHIISGAAEYYRPQIQTVLECDKGVSSS